MKAEDKARREAQQERRAAEKEAKKKAKASGSKDKVRRVEVVIFTREGCPV